MTAVTPELKWRDHAVSAAALQKKAFEPVPFVVQDLIPDGLTILAGAPKVGKSWLVLDVGLAVATGGTCPDGREVEQGDVLYLALEDNQRRLQRRLGLLATDLEQWPERLTLATAWRRFGQKGDEDIEEWVSTVKKPRLIIVDTLAGIRAPPTTSNAYTDDYRAVEGLQRWSGEEGVPVIVVHHTRKAIADDPIDRVSGTLGLTGGVDTIMVLDRTSRGTTLFVRGRDVEEAEHAVAFDRETYRWKILGDAEDVRRSDIRKDILFILQTKGEAMSPDQIATSLGKTSNAIRQRIREMAKAGEVVKVRDGLYVHPDHYDWRTHNSGGS